MRNYVVCPTCLDERHGGVNNDRTDALELATRLDRFLAGNDKAQAIVRVPTEAEEQKRARKRQRQQLREQRLSLATLPQGITLPPCGGNVRPGDDPATVPAQAPADKSAGHWRGPGEGLTPKGRRRREKRRSHQRGPAARTRVAHWSSGPFPGL